MLTVSIITPEGTVYTGEADSVTLPTADGEITVLPHHIPLVGIVVPGTILLRKGGEAHFIATSRGVVEVDGKGVSILADSADRADELQEDAIRRAMEDAERLKTEKRNDAEGFAEATAMLDRELARLRTIRRHRTHRGMPQTSE
ncbi:MAG: F-type H+-transporting ATPase subunit epsilon [Candidatus Peregrinibacteria bacterium Gr01-1014_25]|nr:MAG: F-type H+-transporting ATPase subunit epsilon [Candidatus Peregrinibacteria bacterium Gr01-1014_25]